ncbi:MAG: GAF domain-containing protein [Mycobacterium sp.]|nr:GAF domain-containing protein [Mycobacterium sp.]
MQRGAVWLFVVVLLAYAAGAVLSWSVFGHAAGPAFFYPPAGVAVAALILSRRSRWPAVVAAIVVGEAAVDIVFGTGYWAAGGYALANAVESLIGAAVVLAWCGGWPDLRERRDLTAFLIGACVLAPVAGGLLGGAVTSIVFGSHWVGDVAQWWAGDALGVLVIGAPILLWSRQKDVIAARPLETAAVLLLTTGVGIAAFWTDAPPSTLILPLLAWAALRLNMIGAALAGAVTAFIATTMASLGRGAFADITVSPANQLVLTQLYVGIVVTVALLIAQEAAARMQAVREREIERRERMRLEGLSELARQLSAALGPHDIGRALQDHVINDAGAKSLNLGLLTQDGLRLKWVAMAGYPPEVMAEFGAGVDLGDRLVATDVVKTGRPVLVTDQSDYQSRYGAGVRWLAMNGTQSMAGWPLSAGGRPFGCLVMMWPDVQPFDPSQMAYISAVATMVSQALVRARVYADEHARAAVLQAAILPTTAGDIPGVDVSVNYEPADLTQGLGGDWFDVMRLPKDRVYFAVGDVMGQGLAAVEDMAQLRSAGRALAHQGLPPDQILAELNGFTRDASHNRFATMAVAIFEPESGMLSYCVAGHPPPLLRRAATGEVVTLCDTQGPVLGPLAQTSFIGGRVRAIRGDILVLYTDGLVERRGTDIADGIARARTIMSGWGTDGSLQDDCAAMRDTLAPRPRNDDVCLIAVRFGGAGGRV